MTLHFRLSFSLLYFFIAFFHWNKISIKPTEIALGVTSSKNFTGIRGDQSPFPTYQIAGTDVSPACTNKTSAVCLLASLPPVAIIFLSCIREFELTPSPSHLLAAMLVW